MNQNPKRVLKPCSVERELILVPEINESKPEEGTETGTANSSEPPAEENQ